MLKKDNRTELNDADFIEAVILKVRRYERRKKLGKAVMAGVAFVGVWLFAGLPSLTTPENTVDAKNFDVVTGNLLHLNEMDAKYQDDFGFNAGKPCPTDYACENC